MRLEVLDYAGPGSWRWRLTDAGGAFVADHQVNVDVAEWQFAAFTDLYRWLRWNLPPEPDLRTQREGELLVEIGQWVSDRLLGPVAAALTRARGKDAARLELPAEAAEVGLWPWELAWVGGRSLVGHRVRLVVCPQPHASVFKAPVGQRLRMLAVFSLPEGAGAALNLRKERYALSRLVEQIAKVNHKAVELKVVQYGATRQALENVLLEEPGWDVMHLSGHGLAGGLVLETDTGDHDLISTDELVELLDYAGEQLKLVTLSACESGAATAEQHLRRLGLGPDLAPTTRTDTDTDGSGPVEGRGVSGLAGAVADRLDAAVLAMRYPVVDEFAIALAGRFYDLVLGKGQPVSKALALGLSQATAEVSPGVSAGVPTLVGERAAALTVAPPAGDLILSTDTRLAGFPPQPERLVGRGGPLTRAAAALAPGSGRSGVLFHGMAGAGKTTCAVELAYTHQDSFTFMAWYQAPPEGHDITTALTDFALALERQVAGLKLVHQFGTLDALHEALPVITQLLEQNRVLVVVDNAESLLTEAGGWRDERWGLLVQAMTAHQGLSRLVLTSRRRPADLEAGVMVEAVHALSIQESVLLARDLPNLGALLDDTAASALVARVLQLVQGHPKLLELADGQATDPNALRERLARADTSWHERGVALEPFLERGETPASEQDFLAVLQGWTRDATTVLPEASAVFLRLLCCLEDDDRIHPVIEGNWANLWQRLELPGDPPALEPSLWAPLTEQALISIGYHDDGTPYDYRVHPGVAETVRKQAGQAFRDAVDTETADYWLNLLNEAHRREQDDATGWLVRRAALSAAPYLLRQHRWSAFDTAAEGVLKRDTSAVAAAGLLPLLTVARDATRGTHDELFLGRTHARALRVIDAAAAEAEFERLLTQAENQQRFQHASSIAGDLATLYRDRGRLDDALAMTERQANFTRRTDRGPWTRLVDETQRLQILRLQGHDEQVLQRVEQLRNTMTALPEHPGTNDSTVDVWNAREVLLEVGTFAAQGLKQWEKALTLNAEKLASMRDRDASDYEMALARYNDYAALLRLGRTQEAIELLQECHAVFQAANDLTLLANTLGALADAESDLDHDDRAVTFQADGLRVSYPAGRPDGIAIGHDNLASYQERSGGDARMVWAHRVAAAMIQYQTGNGRLATTLIELAEMLPAGGPERPVMFAEVCQLVDQTDGVHLAELLDRLPRRAPDGQAALDAVLELAPQAGDQRKQQLVQFWEPMISALHASLTATAETAGAAAAVLEQVLLRVEDRPDWRVLVGVLRRMQAGERDAALLQTDGLDKTGAAIATRALAVLTGQAEVDTEAWHIFTTHPDTTDQEPDRQRALVAAVVATVRGDTDAGAQVEGVLSKWDADPETAGLAQALRRVLAGERDPVVLTAGLDPDASEVIGLVLEVLRTANTETDAGIDSASVPGSTGRGEET